MLPILGMALALLGLPLLVLGVSVASGYGGPLLMIGVIVWMGFAIAMAAPQKEST